MRPEPYHPNSLHLGERDKHSQEDGEKERTIASKKREK
jgi:hypothetical protein